MCILFVLVTNVSLSAIFLWYGEKMFGEFIKLGHCVRISSEFVFFASGLYFSQFVIVNGFCILISMKLVITMHTSQPFRRIASPSGIISNDVMIKSRHLKS